MMRRSVAAQVAVATTLLLGGCSGDDDDPAAAPDEAAEAAETEDAAPDDDEASSATSTTTTEPAIPEPVPTEGSVIDVLSGIEGAANFSAAVDGWLAEVPGQDGVLRNPRGVTLFVPGDDGFTESDRDAALADPDAFAEFLGQHLFVGTLTVDGLGDVVTTAMGESYEIGDGPTIGGQTIVEADLEATNGVVHLIDGPLVPVPTGE